MLTLGFKAEDEVLGLGSGRWGQGVGVRGLGSGGGGQGVGVRRECIISMKGAISNTRMCYTHVHLLTYRGPPVS